MDLSFEIPIVARGRVIMPDATAIEFSGRNGAKFRTPDAKKHVHDLVLGNPVMLGDLADTPIADILDFLAELGDRLRLENNGYLQESFALAVSAGGLPESVLRHVYGNLPYVFDRAYISQLIESTIGARYLDGWVAVQETSPNVRVRAVGTRQLHITAGNVPVVAAVTILRGALSKSDVLIKSPSNDPLTAAAIARTMIDLDANHPVTKHVAVAYWKGGDEELEKQIVRPSRIDKITAWGGMASVAHIQKFLSPGIDLTALNPKFSVSVVGREALDSERAMEEAANGVAVMSGFYNQTACSNTRLVYVESETDDESIDRLIAFGRKIVASYDTLPSSISTRADTRDIDLEFELEAAALEEEFYHVEGDTVNGGVVISRFPDRVDFFDQLRSRVINLVPVSDLADVTKWCDDTTQTVGIYPESLRERLLDILSLAGVQRVVPLTGSDPWGVFQEIQFQPAGMPHDGIEPLRRSVRWVVDHRPSETEPSRSGATAAAVPM